jgi:enamine deaminase RidA (YjgF/YER057c/UK114 family)
MSTPEDKLAELGITLPHAPAPLAAYVPAVRAGSFVFTSGQLPLVDGELRATGIVGRDLSVEEAAECARLCAVNALAAVRDLIGELSLVKRIVKVTGFVASTVDCFDQPLVVNGASELLGEVFGDAGTHARAAVGVAVLPKNAPVEVELIVEL